MTVASFIAVQRTEHGVPHALSCRALGMPTSTFYKWHDRPPTPSEVRRGELDAAVRASFEDSGGNPGTYGSPRVWEDLVEAGWRVSKKTVAASMARQGLVGRSPKRKRRSLTRPDKAAAPIPDLVRRDFRAAAINQKWCGDLTEIPMRRGQALPGDRGGPRVAAPGGLRAGRASRRVTREGGAVHGRRGARRRCRRRDLPLRQGRRVHR